MNFDLQITAGRGPRECAYVVARLLQVLLKEADAAGLKCTILSSIPLAGDGPAAMLSAVVRLTGDQAAPFAATWLGTVQWVGQSPYRPTHKRKNWFVSVSEVDTRVAEGKLTAAAKFESMRASGPGGQNVNKTNSAVRAVDPKSGIVVTARETRSQTQNRKVAVSKLKQRLAEQAASENMATEKSRWDNHQGVVRGNASRVFRGDNFVRG